MKKDLEAVERTTYIIDLIALFLSFQLIIYNYVDFVRSYIELPRGKHPIIHVKINTHLNCTLQMQGKEFF